MSAHWRALVATGFAVAACNSDPPAQAPPVEDEAAEARNHPAGRGATARREAASPVPLGIKGLSFGMSKAEAIAALPELSAGRTTGSSTVSAEQEGEAHEPGTGSPPLASSKPRVGLRITAKTSIGQEPAACQFDFAVPGATGEYGLSRIGCRLGPEASKFTDIADVALGSYRTRAGHCAAFARVLDTLRSKYGAPSHTGEVDEMAALLAVGMEQEACPAEMTWKSRDAALELRSVNGIVTGIGDDLSIVNYSAAHTRALEAAASADRARREALRQEREARAEEERMRKLEEAGNVQRAMSDDL